MDGHKAEHNSIVRSLAFALLAIGNVATITLIMTMEGWSNWLIINAVVAPLCALASYANWLPGEFDGLP